MNSRARARLEEFFDVYEQLTPAGRAKLGFELCWLFILKAIKNPSRVTIQMTLGALRFMVWPYLWRGLLWLTTGVLILATLARLAK